MLATAGDDGNVLLWVPAENQTTHNFEEGLEDKETWRVKTMCRSNTSEIYDLAWSPDGVFFITGSMDNIARIYNAQTGTAQRSVRLLRPYLLSSRQHRTADCRAQPLCPGRGVGPVERVHRDPVLRPIGTYLHIEEQGRPILACTTQQSHQNGSPCSTGILEQSCAARLRRPCFVHGRHRVSRALHARHSPVTGIAHYACSTDIAQPPLVVRLVTLEAAVCVSSTVDASSRSHAKLAQHEQHRPRRSECANLLQRDSHVVLQTTDVRTRRQPSLHPSWPVQSASSSNQRSETDRRHHQHSLYLYSSWPEQASSRLPARSQEAFCSC
jgi:hypothetical protein